ncbi:MAG: isocitrate/isopropylmalate family dehydrogenase [Deltaproteobacteria bacterium]|jgi:isocitrate dehydrogenase (NAD+)|nr:MAG: isocitrate/isopropylmalate family dehydrogenase [Deltaproteobacteria bacterium]
MSRIGDTHRVTLIPGDGIGPEVTDAARRIIDSTGVRIEWEVVPAGIEALEKYQAILPEITFESIKRNGVALKGPIGTPIGEGFKSVNVTIRKTLDLYANLRPVKSFPRTKSRYENIDIVVVRENTEDLYSGLEYEIAPGVVETLKVITERASLRIANFAFKFAKKRGRKKVTVLHKANIMKLSDGLFLNCVRRVAKEFPQIEYEEMIVDNACMQLVLDPNRFDVILTENLYGDIVSEICAGLVGGLGFAPGANIGDKCAVFEAVHGSAPDIAGKNLANPIAITLSGVLLLNYIGEGRAGRIIEKAITRVLEKGEVLTRDMGGSATTTEMRDAIIEEVKRLIK